MKVEINVNEVQFKEILDKELVELPKEMIQNVIVESIREYFTQNNYQNIENLFIYDKKGYGWSSEKSASKFLEGVIDTCDFHELQTVIDEAVKNLRDNNEHILRQILKDMLIEGMVNEYSFRRSLENALDDILRCRNS